MYTLARTSARGWAPVSQVNGAFSQTKVGPKVLYLDDQNFDQDKPSNQNGETFCEVYSNQSHVHSPLDLYRLPVTH